MAFIKTYYAFGVLTEIKFYGYDESEFKEYFDYSRTYLTKMDKLTDRYRGYDDFTGIYYINNNPDKDIKIDEALFDLIEYSIEKGCEFKDEYGNPFFNIGIGKISDLYKDIFDAYNGIEIDESIYPSIESINTEYEVDLNKIILDRSNLTIRIPSGMSLDLGGIAKGYAIENLRNIFDERNLKYTINSGESTIITSFGNPYRKNNDYIVALRDPSERLENNSYYALLTIPHNMAISTSGDYQKYFIYNNEIHSHILDSKTNESVKTDIRSITVITKDLSYGDILSTVLYMMGSKEAIEYSISHDDIDIIIYKNDSSIYLSDNIKSIVKLEEKYA